MDWLFIVTAVKAFEKKMCSKYQRLHLNTDFHQ